MAQLNANDYKKILEYYKMEVPKSKRLMKNKAEHILGTKLCRCIKKVDIENEARSIGICTKTIINRKGYTRGTFKCKGKTTIKLSKGKNTTRRSKK
jgi:hypothetical protein